MGLNDREGYKDRSKLLGETFRSSVVAGSVALLLREALAQMILGLRGSWSSGGLCILN